MSDSLSETSRLNRLIWTSVMNPLEEVLLDEEVEAPPPPRPPWIEGVEELCWEDEEDDEEDEDELDPTVSPV
jgi:hypothetical protein